MKKILTLLSILFVVHYSYGQSSPHWVPINNYQKARGVWHDSVDIIPTDTVKNKATNSIAAKNGVTYIFNGIKWAPIGSGVIAFDSSILRGVYMDTAYKVNDSTTRYCKGAACWDLVTIGGGGSIGGDTTILGIVVDSTGQPQHQVLYGAGNNHIGSNSYFIYDSVRHKLVIANRNISFGGNGIKLGVNGNGYFNGTLKIGGYTLPATDGLAGQTLQTNGFGAVTWQTAAGTSLQLQTNGTDNGDQSLLNLADGSGISITDNGTGTVTITNTASTPTWQQTLTQSPDFTQNNTSNFHNYNWRIDSIGALNLYSGRYDLLKRSGNIHLDSSTASLYAQVNDTVRANVFVQSNADSAYFYLPATNNLKSLSILGTSNGRFRIDATNIATSSTNTLKFNDTIVDFSHSGVNTPPKIVVRNSSQLNTASPTTYAVFQNDTLKSITSLPSASGFWPLQTGTLSGLITGQDTITSNTANQLHFIGTWTGTAANQYHMRIAPSITGDATASRTFEGVEISPTLTWGANNQTMAALYINPTFTVGAFTTPQTAAIAHKGDIFPLTTNVYNLGKSGLVYSNFWGTNTNTTNINALSGSQLSVFGNGGALNMYIRTGTSSSRNTKIGNALNTSDSLYMLDVHGEIKSYGSLLAAQLPTPVITSVTNVGTPGSTTYTYKIVFRDLAGNTSGASAAVSTTTGNATLSATNFNTIAWTASETTSQAVYFVDLYRTVGGSSQGKISTTVGYNNSSAGDNNNTTSGDGTTPPAGNTSGNIGAGVLRPLAAIHLRAGVADAGGAAMFFTSGVASQTTQIAGQVNYDGTDIYLSDGTRNYTLNKSLVASATLDFPSTGSGAIADLTITVTGAADGDAVALGVPNGSVTATATYTAWVSAANTVTVRFSPKATEDPSSGTFKVRVIK